jgi:hypothetical protein
VATAADKRRANRAKNEPEPSPTTGEVNLSDAADSEHSFPDAQEIQPLSPSEIANARIAQGGNPQESDFRAMELEVQDLLKDQPKYNVRLFQVPDASSDEKLPDQEVAVNGYVYVLQRGVNLLVPQTVYEILRDAGHV